MKSTNNNSPFPARKLLSLGLAALLGSAGLGSALAADQAVQKTLPASSTKATHVQDTNSSYPGWNTPAMKQVAISSGQALLRHLNASHNALAKKNIGEAKIYLIAANDFAAALKKMIPFIRITDEVKDTHGNILSAKEGFLLDDSLPVYENIEQLGFYAPELKPHVTSKHVQNSKPVKKDTAKKTGSNVDEILETSDTTVYLPVLYVSGLTDNALSALNRKEPDINTAKVAIEKALNGLTAITVSADLVQTENIKKQNSKAKTAITPVIRAELTRVKQSVAFAENLQKEAKHDPKYIYTSLNNALNIMNKLMSTYSFDAKTSAILDSIKKSIENIKTNVTGSSAYAEARKLLEPITDNPGE